QVLRRIAVRIVVERVGQLLVELLDLLLEWNDGHDRYRGHVASDRRFRGCYLIAKAIDFGVRRAWRQRTSRAIAATVFARHATGTGNAARSSAARPTGHRDVFAPSLRGLSSLRTAAGAAGHSVG